MSISQLEVASGRGVAPSIGPVSRGGKALTPQQLEDRKIIHRAEKLRGQADAFRELRTRLSGEQAMGQGVILVAAVRGGSGGSFVARNLAAAFAFDESRGALLVDCNARHPRQAEVFGLHPDAIGLKACLEDPQRAVGDAIHATGVPSLGILPWGIRQEDAGDDFDSMRMRRVVDDLRAQRTFAKVILDGPAVDDGPDSVILSGLVDQVVLVAGYASVTPENVRDAVAAFPAEKVAGVVFNRRP